jgi:putative mRNA 3-end processing factor
MPQAWYQQNMLQETPSGLYCPDGDFFIDPWAPVNRAIVTHAHGDHARRGSRSYLCSVECAPLLARRLLPEQPSIETLGYGSVRTIGSVRVSLHPAGHILGSPQIRVEGTNGVWVIGGDYKRAADPTCAPFVPIACDVFITETTFGLPVFCWDQTETIVDDMLAWWEANGRDGKTSVVFCYTLGKAQRLLAELAPRTDRTIYVHGAMTSMTDAYRAAGVTMAHTETLVERPRGVSFAGELVLAPISARGTPWMRRLGTYSDAFVSGTMRVRGVRRQRAVDRGFVLSDHADWPALLQTVRETGAARVLATHGYPEPFARYLSSQGIDSGVIRTAWEGEATAEAD